MDANKKIKSRAVWEYSPLWYQVLRDPKVFSLKNFIIYRATTKKIDMNVLGPKATPNLATSDKFRQHTAVSSSK